MATTALKNEINKKTNDIVSTVTVDYLVPYKLDPGSKVQVEQGQQWGVPLWDACIKYIQTNFQMAGDRVLVSKWLNNDMSLSSAENKSDEKLIYPALANAIANTSYQSQINSIYNACAKKNLVFHPGVDYKPNIIQPLVIQPLAEGTIIAIDTDNGGNFPGGSIYIEHKFSCTDPNTKNKKTFTFWTAYYHLDGPSISKSLGVGSKVDKTTTLADKLYDWPGNQHVHVEFHYIKQPFGQWKKSNPDYPVNLLPIIENLMNSTVFSSPNSNYFSLADLIDPAKRKTLDEKLLNVYDKQYFKKDYLLNMIYKSKIQHNSIPVEFYKDLYFFLLSLEGFVGASKNNEDAMSALLTYVGNNELKNKLKDSNSFFDYETEDVKQIFEGKTHGNPRGIKEHILRNLEQ